MPRVIVLVVIFGHEELSSLFHDGSDLAATESLQALLLLFEGLGFNELLIVCGEDCRSVLGAFVRALSILLRGIVKLKERFQQLSIA